jgi:phage host-nuclease inhibitor protein Gam
MAKKPAKKKPSVKALPVPTSLAQAATYQRNIGRALGAIQHIEQALQERVDELAKEAEEKVVQHQASIVAMGKAVRAFAEAHRQELTDGGARKSVTVPNAGSFRWYTTPPAIQVAKEEVEAVIERIKTLGFTEFIRTKEELNKEAMLEKPDVAREIAGVSISKKEKFAILAPGDSEMRLECSLESNRWKLVSTKKDPLPS